MAKVRIPPTPIYTQWPCLIFYHNDQYLTPDPHPRAFHLIAAWDAPWFNPWHGLIRVPMPAAAEFIPGIVTAEQIALAQHLYRDPAVLNDMCWVCCTNLSRPRVPRWNIHRGGIINRDIPAVAFLDVPFNWCYRDDWSNPIYPV